MDKKLIDKIIIISSISLSVLIIGAFLIFHLVSAYKPTQATANVQVSLSTGTYYYTRYTGCTQPLNASKLGVMGHGVYFTSPNDCLQYNNPVGYLSIFGG